MSVWAFILLWIALSFTLAAVWSWVGWDRQRRARELRQRRRLALRLLAGTLERKP